MRPTFLATFAKRAGEHPTHAATRRECQEARPSFDRARTLAILEGRMFVKSGGNDFRARMTFISP
jgi:hypothetical protein